MISDDPQLGQKLGSRGIANNYYCCYYYHHYYYQLFVDIIQYSQILQLVLDQKTN